MRASAAVGSRSRRAANRFWSRSSSVAMSISVLSVFDRPTRGEHCTVKLGENLPRIFEKKSPSARQPHPPFVAIEQPNLNFLLQLFDLVTERRLRDVEALRGTTKIKLFSDRDEIPQMTRLHGRPSLVSDTNRPICPDPR